MFGKQKRHMMIQALCCAFVFCCFATVASAQPSGNDIAETGCDIEYVDALEARAHMMGQRRTAQHRNLIFKPDSVLEYSCFTELVEVIGSAVRHDGSLFFSETDEWGTVGEFTDLSLEYAFLYMVSDTVVSYLDSNFIHRFLNDRPPPVLDPLNPVSGSYNCDAMRYVWRQARCMNFMDRAETDGFYDFSYYAHADPRRLPEVYEMCEPDPLMEPMMLVAYAADGISAGPGGSRTERIIEGHEYYITGYDPDFDPDTDTPSEETHTVLNTGRFLRDPVIPGAHLDRMLPIPGNCNASEMIPTGVRVTRLDGIASYDEHFCTQPGCSYVPEAGRCIMN